MASNLDLIMGGIGSASAGLSDYANKNRQVHPAIQKFMQLVMSGQMSGKQAALAAHHEMGTFGQPQQGQDPGQGQAMPMPASGGSGSDPTAEWDSPYPEPQSLSEAARPQPQMGAPQMSQRPQRQQMSRPSAPPEVQDRPYTAQDLGDLNSLSGFIRSTREPSQGLSLEDRMALLERSIQGKKEETDTKEGGKNTRQGRGIEAKSDLQDERLKQQSEQFHIANNEKISARKQHMVEVLARIDAMLKASHSKDTLSAARIMLDQYKADMGALKSALSDRAKALSPDFEDKAAAQEDRALKELEAKKSKLDAYINGGLKAHDHNEKASSSSTQPAYPEARKRLIDDTHSAFYKE